MYKTLLTWVNNQGNPDKAGERMFNLAQQLFNSIVISGQADNTRKMTFLISLPDGETMGGDLDIHPEKMITKRIKKAYPYLEKLNASDGNGYGFSMDPDDIRILLMLSLIWNGAITIRSFTGEQDKLTNLPIKTVTLYMIKEEKVYLLSEAEVFNAYCTDSETGDPIAPEPATKYIASPELLGFPTVNAVKNFK